MGGWRLIRALSLVAALAACDPLTTTSPSRPDQRDQAAAPVAPAAPSARSRALASYYAEVERMLLVEDLLRTDGGGPDTPFTARQLADNFTRIALFEELTLVAGRYEARETQARLRRWSGPINVSVQFGASVPQEMQSRDLPRVSAYVSRLARVSGAPISMAASQGTANFHVAVLSADELGAFGPRLLALVPDLQPSIAQQITQMPRNTYCAVYTFSDARAPDAIITAIAIIRAEHPNLLRDSCYHEEIAQGLGLPNDSERARPSIFNDDNEFALLTSHDELLLRMLYDRRLTPGTSLSEAAPVIRAIASELIGGES